MVRLVAEDPDIAVAAARKPQQHIPAIDSIRFFFFFMLFSLLFQNSPDGFPDCYLKYSYE